MSDKSKKKKVKQNSSRPVIGTVATTRPFEKFSTHPSEQLSPERLGAIFREAEYGDIARQMELFEEIEEKDTHLFSQLQTRKNAVTGLDWSILPASDQPEDKKISEFIGDIIYNYENIDKLFLNLLDAIGKGFSVAEIMWSYKDGRDIIQNIEWIHPKNFRFNEYGQLRLLTRENQTEGIKLPPNKFITHKYEAKSGSPVRSGILRIAVWMYLFKNYAIKDWMAFSEVYGMPIRIGRYEPGTSQDDKDALIRAVQTIGADAAGVISKDTEIQFIESVRSEGLLYDRLCKFCNAEISKAILGQTLTSEPGDSGSYSLGKTQSLVRQDLLEADCKALQKTLKRDLIRPLVEFHFGTGYRLPWIKFNYESPEDLVQSSQIYRTLIVDMGLPVTHEHIYEKFGIPVPDEGQQTLQPQAAMQQMNYPFKAEKPSENFTMAAKNIAAKDAQTATDELCDSSLNPLLKAVEQTLGPLLEVIKSASSLENLRDELLNRFKDLPADEFEELLQKAIFVADLNGRAAVIEDGNQ